VDHFVHTGRAFCRRKRSRDLVRRHYHDCGWVNPYRQYERLLADVLSAGSVVLDVGCGGDWPTLEYLLTCGTVPHGIDPVVEEGSPIAHSGGTLRRGRAEAIPYPDGFFDAAVSRCVLEHLQSPIEAFRELRRVLKPGGLFALLTPNRWDYVSLCAKLIPNRLHARLVRRLESRQETDTFPTFYRANSARDISRLAAETGFVVDHLAYTNEFPSMLMGHRVLCGVMIAYDELIGRFPGLHWLKGWILGCLRSTGKKALGVYVAEAREGS